jgi:hypothetical protein
MASVEGRVIDNLTSKGVRKARVSLDVEGITAQDCSAETDEEGYFLLSNIPAGIYTLHVQFSPKSMVYSFGDSIENIELSGDTHKELIVPIEIRGALVGRVRDATKGTPLQGVSVKILEETGGGIGSPTNEDGKYSISFIRPGSYTVIASAEGYERTTSRVFVDQVTKGEGETRLDIFMNPIEVSKEFDNGVVRGNVVNEFGRVLFGARIELIREGFVRVASVIKDWEDQYRGNFSVDDVPPGKCRIVVSRPGYEALVREITVERGRVTWVNDLILKLATSPPPPELEYIRIEPDSIAVGEDIKIIIKSKDPEILGISAHMWGPKGWNMGFSVDEKKEEDGGKSKIFKNWQIIGMFVIDSVNLTDKHGKTFIVTSNATFEVHPRTARKVPLTPDSPLFK